MLDTRERNLLYYGDARVSPPQRIPLRAGPLSLIYENGDLRHIRYHGREILSRIYAAVRDKQWGTPSPVFTEEARKIGEDTFRITYTAKYQDESKGLEYMARVTLTGEADGTIMFEFLGEALSAFERNRIGICVLHPAFDCRALPVTITHSSGTTEEGAFPDQINPHQPFFDIFAITHEVVEGVRAGITFTGDTFEMEDQRNWSDNSYKTYSTPLALPKPVLVQAGDREHQTVRLALSGEVTAELTPHTEEWVTVTITDEEVATFPGFGLMLQPDSLPPSDDAEMVLHGLRLDHLRVDVDAKSEEAGTTIAQARNVAAMQELPLLVGLKNATGLTREALADAETGIGAIAAYLFLSHSGEELSQAGQLRTALPEGAFLAAGSSNNFTELNRNRPNMAEVDGLVYSATPQVHAFDNSSIMETPAMYAMSLETARTFADGKPVFLGPLTLYRPGKREAPQQKGLMGAAWYAAALAYAAQGGADRITLCDISGEHGLVDEDGDALPVLSALMAMGTATGSKTQRLNVTDRYRVACAAFRSEDGEWQDIFVINLQPETVPVTIAGVHGVSARVRALDETTGGRFSAVVPMPVTNHTLSLNLMPYAVVQIISGAAVYAAR